MATSDKCLTQKEKNKDNAQNVYDRTAQDASSAPAYKVPTECDSTERQAKG